MSDKANITLLSSSYQKQSFLHPSNESVFADIGFVSQLFIIPVRKKLQTFLENQTMRSSALFMRISNRSLWLSRFRSISIHYKDFKKNIYTTVLLSAV